MGSGWMTSPGGPWYGEMKNEEINASQRIRTEIITFLIVVQCVDSQEVQEVRSFQSLPLVQFDPEEEEITEMLHLKRQEDTCCCFRKNAAFNETLTDDPLAPLGPGGP